jgi:hypothetical protein
MWNLAQPMIAKQARIDFRAVRLSIWRDPKVTRFAGANSTAHHLPFDGNGG